MTVLGPEEIASLLPMDAAVAAMRLAFAAHSEGRSQVPPRSVLHTGGARGSTLVMPAALDGELVVKVVSVFPENFRHGLPAIHGTVLVVDSETGAPQALLEGGSLTAIRTAAACGLATDLLARPESTVLAVFGSGVHARTQVRAAAAVRSIKEVRIFNPNLASARAMAEEIAATAAMPGRIAAVGSPSEALDGADIASLATTSTVPVFDDGDVPDGIHINAIGSFKPGEREVPAETVARARVVVDDFGAALEEAGDLLMPMSEGLFGEEHIHCDLDSLVLGQSEGRTSSDQVTFFKSVGLAIQDVVAAQTVLREARKRGVGKQMTWGS